MKELSGNLVDLFRREIYPCTIVISEGRILSVRREEKRYDQFILPGFVDAHLHVESSMLLPAAFAKAVLPRGTIAVVNDPHEIANVLGIAGIEVMMEDGASSPLKFYYGIPSCVPATPFDRAGSCLSVKETEALARSGKFVALSEMMNVPGVLGKDPTVIAKLEIAKRYQLRVDGHAPGLRGEALSRYIAEGIETDHESVALEEAIEKLKGGLYIFIREGSASKNYEALKSVIADYPDRVMFCTDDTHPDDLLQEGHIDKLVRRALADGFDLFDVLRVASLNPVMFYNLDVGMLRVGDRADFIIVEDLPSMKIRSTYIDGVEVYRSGEEITAGTGKKKREPLNFFQHDPISPKELQLPSRDKITAIRIIPNELITRKEVYSNEERDVVPDLLKVVYINRYTNDPPQVAYITGVGIKTGAFASCIAHDSHNVIAVGCNDEELCEAINAIIEQQGGLAVRHKGNTLVLPLPFGGIVSMESAQTVAAKYLELNREIKAMGSELESPFMTLSFMALIVVPALKIGERGLFDVERFEFITT